MLSLNNLHTTRIIILLYFGEDIHLYVSKRYTHRTVVCIVYQNHQILLKTGQFGHRYNITPTARLSNKD